jgi:ABC-type transport system involved in cytochrome c biogenesis permease subunit
LDVITDPNKADEHKVFRIENQQLLQALKLEERPGFRYAYNEFKDELERFRTQVRQARAVQQANSDDLTPYQRGVLKLQTKLNEYEVLKDGFARLPLPPIPTRGEMGAEADRDDLLVRLSKIRTSLDRAAAQELGATQTAAPRAVPKLRPFGWNRADRDEAEAAIVDDKEAWLPFSIAWPRAYLQQQFDKMREDKEGMVPFEGFLLFFSNPTTIDYLKREYERQPDDSPALALNAIFDAYLDDDAARFNEKVADYQSMLRKRPPQNYAATMLATEARFNSFQPFLYTAFLYVFALVLACVGWLTWSIPSVHRILNRSSTWLLLLVLVVHTGALITRIVISGRPPVTNLYSSAIFIGWGAVVLGLIFEAFSRKGFGNAIAGITGFFTLMVAYYLSLRGDTIEPMRAVLDTQFWLTTHVVIIALGYAATFVAGMIGALYIFLGLGTPVVSPGVSKILHRMIYGVLCFAIIFSFVGTVLGGLWADDSWGRFWGWDPKENGALIIVLWNALVLHARFGGIVRDRGLAVLAVFGNIVTAWSWFGTNELKVGLHSYGFTEGVVMWLLIFAASQFVIIALGCLPRFCWWSFRESDNQVVEQTPILMAETA